MLTPTADPRRGRVRGDRRHRWPGDDRGSAPLRAMLVIGFGSGLVVAPLLGVLVPAHFNGLGELTWSASTMSAFAVGSMMARPVRGHRAPGRRRAVYVAVAAASARHGRLHHIARGLAGGGRLALVGVGGGLLSRFHRLLHRAGRRVRPRSRAGPGQRPRADRLAAGAGRHPRLRALSVTTLEVAATWLLAAWVLRAAYASPPWGCTFAAVAGGVRRRPRLRSWRPTVLTRGRLARYVGVSIRTVRHYHAVLGPVAEPDATVRLPPVRRRPVRDRAQTDQHAGAGRGAAGADLGLLAAEPDDLSQHRRNRRGPGGPDGRASPAPVRSRPAPTPSPAASPTRWPRSWRGNGRSASATSVEIERNNWNPGLGRLPVDARGVPDDEADLSGR